MAVIDFSQIDKNEFLQAAFNEILFDETINKNLKPFVNIFNKIVFNKQVIFAGEGSLLGKKGYSCDPTNDDWKITTRQVKWSPREWSSRIPICVEEIENIITAQLLPTGAEHGDITESTQIMSVIIDKVKESLQKAMWRLVFFNEENIKNVADGGVLSDGVDTDYFNILDGLFVQMNAQVTNNAKQKVEISANAGTSYTAQAITPEDAKDLLQAMYFKAPLTLRAMTNNAFYVTQSIFDAYDQYLSVTKTNETQYSNFVDGVKSLKFHGLDVVAMPIWDEIISAYFNNGTKLDNPHRAILSNKDVLGVAVDDLQSFENAEIFYDKKDRKVYIDVAGKIDAKLLNPNLFVLGI